MKGQQSGQDNQRRKVEGKEPKDGEKTPEGGQKPESGRKEDQASRGGGKPPEGAKEEEAKNEVPAWFAELPEEARRAIVGGSVEDVPAKYRSLLERYRKWLAEQAKPRK